MFGTQIDDSMTVTTPPKANPRVIGTKIYGLQVDPIWFLAMVRFFVLVDQSGTNARTFIHNSTI